MAGSSRLTVYRSDVAGTNKPTAATCGVADELDALVGAIRGRGVSFEHDDLPGTDPRSRHPTSWGRGVWFRDPDGNMIGLLDQ